MARYAIFACIHVVEMQAMEFFALLIIIIIIIIIIINYLTSTATASTQLGDPASTARLRFVRGEVAEAEKNIYNDILTKTMFF